MNEQVEEIYTRMFAPNDIPQPVVELFNRTKFFLDRVDARISPSVLGVIAATATTPTQQAALPTPKLPDEIDLSEPEAPAPTAEEIAQISNAAPVPGVPTGPMDAPITQTEANPKTELQLQAMKATELKAHAKEFFKKDWPLRMGKKQMIKAIMQLNKAQAMR
jgi:hypothetical protein